MSKPEAGTGAPLALLGLVGSSSKNQDRPLPLRLAIPREGPRGLCVSLLVDE